MMGMLSWNRRWGVDVEPVGFGSFEDVVVGEFFEEEFDGLLGSCVGVELEEFSNISSCEVGGPVVGFGLGGDEPVEAEVVAEADAFEHGACFGDHRGIGIFSSAHPGGVDEG